MKNQTSSVERELIPGDEFINDFGISRTTFWRWRKRGWITTVEIAGRHYLHRDELTRFQDRARQGHFATVRKIGQPEAGTGGHAT
jgi:hypothetical protein